MVFTSHIFLFYFLGISLILYYISPRFLKHIVLTALSYIFYGWIQPWYILLIFFSTCLDYYCGLLISKKGNTQKKRKFGLILSICANLGVLFFFKYTGFALENVNHFYSFIGISPPEFPGFLYTIILPIGISFYTFQSMSYSIDLYQGNARPAKNFIDFACYVSMYPQLVAGPIVRYQSIANQLYHRTHTISKFIYGFTRFNFGFAKKILIANTLGSISDLCFDSAPNGTLLASMAWIGIICYAFQIYYDFSAYSDMAIGLGYMFGFKFPENFNSPYKSKSITEFWRRWHISLSSFLRDYLYIPLGGNKKGKYRTYFNLMTVMLLGGLWHGASWNFVVWGLIHGVVLSLERILGKKSFYSMLPDVFKVTLTFCIVLISWVFFRAENFTVASEYIKSMFGLNYISENAGIVTHQFLRPFIVFIFFIAIILTFFSKNTQEILSKPSPSKTGASLLLLFISICMMFTQDFNPFIYFQF